MTDHAPIWTTAEAATICKCTEVEFVEAARLAGLKASNLWSDADLVAAKPKIVRRFRGKPLRAADPDRRSQ